MASNRGVAVIAAALLLHATTTWGEQAQETPSLSFNGFGTAGLVHSNEERADFVSNFLVPDGVGRSSEWSAEVDSRLGLQLTADLAPRLSSVAQVVVEQRYDDTYTPTLEWANIKYDVTPDLYMRGGRIVLPGLMASEYRKVGYALTQVRPPSEVYGLLPLTNSDGLDAGYDFNLGGFNNSVRINYGRRDFHLPDGSETDASGVGVAGSAERGPLTFHLGYLRSRITVDVFQTLGNAFRRFGPGGAAIAERLEFDDELVEFFGAGARYDPGDWFVMGEFARLDGHETVLGQRDGWYLSGGYRLGSFTPYVTVARIRTDGAVTSHPGVPTAGLPPPLAAGAGQLNAGLNAALGLAPEEQDSISLGLRWDIGRNLALKTQVDYLDLDAGSSGVLVNERPDFRRGGSVTLFSITLDFVF